MPGEGRLRLRPHALAVGGEAIARTDSGKVVFVDAALPGELVDVEVSSDKKDFARGSAVAIAEASPDRVLPSCPQVALGCGGCGWQHIDADVQPNYKREIVVDALKRVGRIRDAADWVSTDGALPSRGHRTTVRARIDSGRPAFRAAASHDLVPFTSCETAHPVVDAVLTESTFDPAVQEVTVRFSEATGDLMVICDPAPGASQIHRPAGVSGRTVLVGKDETRTGDPRKDETRTGDPRKDETRASDSRNGDSRGGAAPTWRASTMERIAGVALRVSAGSFFQTRSDGAQRLVELVGRALSDDRADTLIDLYGGVGLFAATVGAEYRTVVSVEGNPTASADAASNLADRPDAFAINEDVDRWRPELAGGRRISVVADPSRSGLGRAGVATIEYLSPDIVVLVSCDAGSLGRDARLIIDAGFDYDGSVVVDMFPMTPHVEVVSRFLARSPEESQRGRPGTRRERY